MARIKHLPPRPPRKATQGVRYNVAIRLPGDDDDGGDDDGGAASRQAAHMRNQAIQRRPRPAPPASTRNRSAWWRDTQFADPVWFDAIPRMFLTPTPQVESELAPLIPERPPAVTISASQPTSEPRPLLHPHQQSQQQSHRPLGVQQQQQQKYQSSAQARVYIPPTPQSAPATHEVPIPKDVLDTVEYIKAMPHNQKDRKSRQLGLPPRHLLRKDKSLRTEFDCKYGALKSAASGSKLGRWVGDTRLFSADAWEYLLHEDVGSGVKRQ